MVFADMRGTKIVPIWDEPCPYVYASGQSEEAWKRRRAINKALEDLDGVNIPHRFSFYDECEPDGLFFGYEEDLADGKCKLCGKEFNRDGLFCSQECEKAHSQLEEMRQEEYEAEVKCSLCGKQLNWYGKDYVLHHVDYQEEKTIPVCRSCHRKIHAYNANFPDLAPQKPKLKTNKNKSHLEAPNSEKPRPTNLQQPSKTFEAPSETFKKRKASRDRVKHPRY